MAWQLERLGRLVGRDSLQVSFANSAAILRYPETHRDWGRKISMSDEVVARVDSMWSELGLPGSGKAIWKK